MRTALRSALGIAGGLVVVALGVHQIASGVKEMSGPAVSPQTQTLGDRIDIPGHGCSLRAPQGWTQKTSARGGVMFVAPKASGYVANLIVGSDKFNDTLRRYADATIDAVKTSVPTAKFSGVEEFATESGAPSYKVTLRSANHNVETAQTMYFFAGTAARKIVVTASCQAANAPELSPLFDACLRSLKVTPP